MANYAWQFFLISEFVSGIKGDLRGVALVAPLGTGNALAAIGSQGILGRNLGVYFNNDRNVIQRNG